jgi:hypothetical protein
MRTPLLSLAVVAHVASPCSGTGFLDLLDRLARMDE